MKNKIVRLVGGAALIAGLVSSPAAIASSPADAAKALAGCTALELPARAASFVAKASVADKQDATVAVVHAAVGLNPAAAVAIVSAVARENPAAAPAIAVTASTLQHKRMDQITKAASAAAPAEAARICGAMIKEFPQDYGVIAIAAAEGAPRAGREILGVVGDYVPALQASIRGAATNFAAGDGNVPVQAILSQSYNQALASGAAARTQVPTVLASSSAPAAGKASAAVVQTSTGAVPNAPVTAATPSSASPKPMQSPFLGPPFIPILGPPFGGGTPVTIGFGGLTPEPPGGRNYSNPN
jgi:hypothetical protein